MINHSYSQEESLSAVQNDQPRQLLNALQAAFECLISRADGQSPLFNMPILQLRCLRIISRNEGQKLVNIATLMNASTPGVSRLVDRLVRQGLVERHQDPTNRRAIMLVTTESARKMLKTIDGIRRDHVAKCIDGLSPSLVDQITRNVITLTENGKLRLADEALAEVRSWSTDSKANSND